MVLSVVVNEALWHTIFKNFPNCFRNLLDLLLHKLYIDSNCTWILGENKQEIKVDYKKVPVYQVFFGIINKLNLHCKHSCFCF